MNGFRVNPKTWHGSIELISVNENVIRDGIKALLRFLCRRLFVMAK